MSRRERRQHCPLSESLTEGKEGSGSTLLLAVLHLQEKAGKRKLKRVAIMEKTGTVMPVSVTEVRAHRGGKVMAKLTNTCVSRNLATVVTTHKNLKMQAIHTLCGTTKTFLIQRCRWYLLKKKKEKKIWSVSGCCSRHGRKTELPWPKEWHPCNGSSN